MARTNRRSARRPAQELGEVAPAEDRVEGEELHVASGVLAREVHGWRKLHKIRQADLARAAGLHVVSLSRIETGAAEPSVSTAIAICKALSRLADQPWSLRVEHVFGDNAQEELRRAQEAAARVVDPHRLDARPFVELLRGLADHERAALLRVAESPRGRGLDASRLRRLLNGKLKTVGADEVDAVCTEVGYPPSTIYTLYPHLNGVDF